MPTGIVITQVANNSPAQQSGIQGGDILPQVNRSRISSLEDYLGAISNSVSGDGILAMVQRGNSKFFTVIRK